MELDVNTNYIKTIFYLFGFYRLIFLKRLLTWWYHRKIKKNEITSENLKKQKTKILDEIMETETYKVAKELLDEFASDQEKRALNVSLIF